MTPHALGSARRRSPASLFVAPRIGAGLGLQLAWVVAGAWLLARTWPAAQSGGEGEVALLAALLAAACGGLLVHARRHYPLLYLILTVLGGVFAAGLAATLLIAPSPLAAYATTRLTGLGVLGFIAAVWALAEMPLQTRCRSGA